jgi:hypothetical protein
MVWRGTLVKYGLTSFPSPERKPEAKNTEAKNTEAKNKKPASRVKR